MHSLTIITALVLAVGANSVSYEGFKVYRMTPTKQKHLDLFQSWALNNEYDFWSNGREIDSFVDVMVSPGKQHRFENLLQDNGIENEIIIKNVERIIRNERIAQLRVPKADSISFDKYNRYDEIQDYLDNIKTNYPEIVRLQSAGKSIEGRDITVVQISSNHEKKKPVLFIDAGIHAREWIAPATALYVIQELVENEDNRILLELFDWHILPLLNPDGYEFTHTDNRFWRKNRANSSSSCFGVDLNRNFGDHWGGQGTSNNPCSDLYRGTKAFSEPESEAVEKYLLSIKPRAKLYLTLHSYGQFILHPWGYTFELPEDATQLLNLGNLVAAKIKVPFNTEYRVGCSTHIMGPTAGGSDDWAKSGAGIKYSYTLELPGGGSQGFDLPPSRIRPVVVETFEGVKEFHDFFADEEL